MLQFWKKLTVILVALGMTGCQAPQRPAARLTLIPETSDQTVPPTAPVSKPPAPAVEKPAPSTALSLPSTNGWIAWESWCLTNNLSKPKRQNHSTNISYALHTTNGIVTLTAGSRLASWNNLVCGLGFAPKLTNGELFIHALDLKKNVIPLLVSAPNPLSMNRIIVIDPGHGGENTGTKSALSKAFEKQYTLDWAMRLEPLLRGAGWQVFFTRTNDVDVSLAERVAFADRVKADLFVSLHFNSLPAPSERSDSGGIETYCLTPVGMPSNMTRDFEDDRQKYFPNNAFDLQNFQYACRLHQAMIEATGRVDRGIRRARFMGVLREQNRPAVLLEGGYLSHPKEARLITMASYRQKLAEAVAKALTP